MNAEILSFHSGKANETILQCEAFISSLSRQLGIENTCHTQIKFEKQQLISELKSSLSRNQIIFFCGDIKEISKAVCVLMHSSGKIYDEYSAFAQTNPNKEELLFPENSFVFFDRQSKEAAFISKISGKTVIALPPFITALSNIVDEYIIPYFSKEFRCSLSRIQINMFGVTLQELTSVLAVLKRKYGILTDVVCTHGILNITISACLKTFSESDNACSNAIAELRRIFGYNIFEMGNRTLAAVTVDLLRKAALTVATAESCTGGFLSETITSVSGASQVLELGICAYSNRIKHDAIGISHQLLDTFGAISKETAVALAEGIKRLSGASLGIGITGVAGPSSSEGKPVGTVYVALSDGNKYWIRSLNMSPDSTRDEIREFAVATALDLIRRYCICLPETLSG
ncbi:MAG: nicotinamide-nucleotide amidohydrolase family protein, partial [Acutalibacteraceae bacterium]|nr:nicotinamide-nucleotide amidohydrolase family protein [Acutalibacteraceae bacterium]